MSCLNCQNLGSYLPDQEEKNHWNDKKARSEYLAQLMKMSSDFSFDKAFRTEGCSKHLFFNCTENDEMYLDYVRFCRFRLCPVCIWRKSLKAFSQFSQIFEVLNVDNYKYVFLTLTVKNCNGENLKDTVSVLLKGFDNLAKTLKRQINLLGYYRSLEVTKNKQNRTYHPHIHVLLVLPSNYFENYYKEQNWYCEMWQRSCKLEYKPVCDVRKVSNKTNKNKSDEKLTKAILEISKYPIKDTDLFYYCLDFSNEALIRQDLITLEQVSFALSGRRLIAFGGILEATRRQLKLDDIEDGDLIHTTEEAEKPYTHIKGYRYKKKYKLFTVFDYQENKEDNKNHIYYSIQEIEHYILEGGDF